VDEEVVVALKKVAKGSVFVLLGFGIYSLGAFLFRVSSARSLSVEDYGVLGFLMALTLVASLMAALGLGAGLPKLIVERRVRGESVRRLIGSAYVLVALSSLAVLALLLFSAPLVLSFLDASFFVYVLSLIYVPFFAFLTVSVAADRGFGSFKVKALLHDGLRGLLLLISSLLLFYYVSSLDVAVLFYVLAVALPSLLAVVYVKEKYGVKLDGSFLKELVLFSLPLLLLSFFGRFIFSMDTLMLSYFLPESDVGLYSAAQTLSQLGATIHNAVLFLFFPLVTSFFVRKKFSEADRFYKLVTKWVLVLSLPLFTILFFYAPQVLSIIFGEEYIPGAEALKILSIGYFVHVFLGGNGASLVALGAVYDLLKLSIFPVIVNFILNATLIPPFGILGAALATSISLIILNVLMSHTLWKKTGVHPFYRKLLVPVVSAVMALVITSYFSFLAPLLQLMLFLTSYALINIILGIFEKEDREILRALRKKLSS